MKWLIPFKKDFTSSRVKAINGRLAKINREIKSLNRFVSQPRSRGKREALTLARGIGSTVLPDSQKRFVSYLSTGSFQTISLRKHEQRSAKIKAVIATIAIIVFVFLLMYFFVRAFFM